MSIEFNHTLVHAKDIWVAAREVGGVLGLAEPSSYGPFAVLQLDNGVTLDFIEDTGEIKAQHYAFLVSENDFDAIWDRLQDRGASGGPTRTNVGPARSTTRTAAAASTGKARTAIGWRSSPVRTAAGRRRGRSGAGSQELDQSTVEVVGRTARSRPCCASP